MGLPAVFINLERLAVRHHHQLPRYRDANRGDQGGHRPGGHGNQLNQMYELAQSLSKQIRQRLLVRL